MTLQEMTQQKIVVCPQCQGVLSVNENQIRCQQCGSEYEIDHRIPNFLVGEGFEDESIESRDACENCMGKFTTENFLIPFLDEEFRGRKKGDLKILSCGCGVACDVDVLNEYGYWTLGIDCGQRQKGWMNRIHQDKLFIASGCSLPFPDEFFDVVYSWCVLPHVGVVGDSYITRDDCWEQRNRFVKEITRVVRRGGMILMSNPNRLFPLDFFHRSQQINENHIPRLHSPWEPFCLSFGDYQALFLKKYACREIEALPNKKYWGFQSLNRTFIGRMCRRIISSYFSVISANPLKFLRSSMFNAWLIVKVTK